MMSAFKKLFGAPKKTADTPTRAGPVEDYVEWRAAHPHDAEQIAAEQPRARHLRCDVHDANLVTVVGFRSRMDSLPSGAFMDAAADNPFCLDVGDELRSRPTNNPARLIFCEACEAGMRARLG